MSTIDSLNHWIQDNPGQLLGGLAATVALMTATISHSSARVAEARTARQIARMEHYEEMSSAYRQNLETYKQLLGHPSYVAQMQARADLAKYTRETNTGIGASYVNTAVRTTLSATFGDPMQAPKFE